MDFSIFSTKVCEKLESFITHVKLHTVSHQRTSLTGVATILDFVKQNLLH